MQGVSAIFPGPYLAWHPEIPSESELTAARDLVLEVLAEEGPFDGLMGFSQGAALAAGLILQHSDQVHPLVDCAVFICGNLPWMLQSELTTTRQKYNAACQTNEVFDSENGIQDPISLEEEPIREKLNSSFCDISQDLQSRAGLLHPANSPLRFPIPTAHIFGGHKDSYFEMSKALIELGNDIHGVKVLDHRAGHVVPRSEYDTDKMAETISWVSERVMWRC